MVFRALTAEQRYRQAMRLSRMRGDRAIRAFLRGEIELTAGGMERDRQAIIREIGRAFDADRELGRTER